MPLYHVTLDFDHIEYLKRVLMYNLDTVEAEEIALALDRRTLIPDPEHPTEREMDATMQAAIQMPFPRRIKLARDLCAGLGFDMMDEDDKLKLGTDVRVIPLEGEKHLAEYNRLLRDELPKWSAIFPEGRHIFYEGDDPYAFALELVQRFAFDPRLQPSFTEARGFGFHCPVDILDEVYGSGLYPMGS